MQFDRYIFGQLIRTTFAVSVVLIGIVWLFQTIKLLELVVNNGAGVTDFLLMSFAAIPLWFTIALPIGAFVGTLWVFFRVLSDRELLVMQAIGMSPLQIARAPIALGVVMSAILVLNSVILLPASFGLYKELQFKLRNNIPAVMLQDGVFIDIVNGMTILIGAHTKDGVAKDIFIHDARVPNKVTTLTAEYGTFSQTNGIPSLQLQNGQRADLSDDETAGALLLFDSHTLSITRNDGGAPARRAPIDMNEDFIWNLLDPEKSPSPGYYNERRAEGHYRITSPFLALALVLMSTAILLRGQMRRDLWRRRASISIGAGIAAIIAIIFARSLITTMPQAIPLIYIVIAAPLGVSVHLLRSVQRDRPAAISEAQA